jgi:hypothetical protein
MMPNKRPAGWVVLPSIVCRCVQSRVGGVIRQRGRGEDDAYTAS